MLAALLCTFLFLSESSYIPPKILPIWNISAGCPTSISVEFPGGETTATPASLYEFQTETVLHEALCACPNVESLTVRFRSHGCSPHPDRYSLPFSLEGGEQYPPLKHLILEGYSFRDCEFEGTTGQRSMKGVVPPGFPMIQSSYYEWKYWFSLGTARKWWRLRKLPIAQRSKSNAALWADAMDWSKLETLELEGGPDSEFEKHISPLLTGLKEVTVGAVRFGDRNALDWLNTLQPLRKLVWWNMIDENSTEWR